jgi:hypothetical protein
MAEEPRRLKQQAAAEALAVSRKAAPALQRVAAGALSTRALQPAAADAVAALE